MNRMMRLTLAAAAGLVLSLLAGYGLAHAGGDSYASMCAGGPAKGECLFYPDPSGTVPENGTPADLTPYKDYQHYGVMAVGPVADNMCADNAVVTETCPFALGSGLNARYAGRPIVYLPFTDLAQMLFPGPAGCISDEHLDGRLVIDIKCGKGSAWVAARYGHFVNVYATDEHDSPDVPFFLYSSGKAGAQAGLSVTWEGGSSESWSFTPCSQEYPCS